LPSGDGVAAATFAKLPRDSPACDVDHGDNPTNEALKVDSARNIVLINRAA
jgi:hypothetical protein